MVITKIFDDTNSHDDDADDGSFTSFFLFKRNTALFKKGDVCCSCWRFSYNLNRVSF